MKRRLAGALIAFASAGIPGTSHAQDTIKIGVLGDMSGPAADLGGPGSVVAAQMAAETLGGTVAGRKIVIVSADHQLKPDIGSEIARRWFDTEKVDAITDLPVSSVALAVQEVARQRGKVLLISGATTPALTDKACSPWTIHWAENIYTLANGMTRAVVKSGGNTWYIITLDFTFGHVLEKLASDVLKSEGAKLLGTVKAPLNASDWSSFVLQAQASKAKIVAIAAGGADFVNALKAAREFGLAAGGQKLAGFLVLISDVHSLGLATAQGLTITESFYWDQNDESRAFAKRFYAKRNVMPTRSHAATYASVVHYLNGVKGAASTDATKVIAWMKQHAADYFGKPATVRRDGRVLFPVGLWEVKGPGESKYAWDYYKQVREIPATEAFAPQNPELCAFLKSK
nr:ABC transporter substrate-binding protein [Nitrosomonas nitrosa]